MNEADDIVVVYWVGEGEDDLIRCPRFAERWFGLERLMDGEFLI